MFETINKTGNWRLFVHCFIILLPLDLWILPVVVDKIVFTANDGN